MELTRRMFTLGLTALAAPSVLQRPAVPLRASPRAYRLSRQWTTT